jgi:tetratricopeptide (TPR) repeat protein
VLDDRPAYAVSIWQDGYRVDPDNLELVYGLALGETRIGQYGNAITYWRQVLNDIDGIGIFRSKFTTSALYIRQISAHAWSAMGWCYFNLGEYDTAKQCMDNSTKTSAVDSDSVTDGSPDDGS